MLNIIFKIILLQGSTDPPRFPLATCLACHITFIASLPFRKVSKFGYFENQFAQTLKLVISYLYSDL